MNREDVEVSPPGSPRLRDYTDQYQAGGLMNKVPSPIRSGCINWLIELEQKRGYLQVRQER